MRSLALLLVLAGCAAKGDATVERPTFGAVERLGTGMQFVEGPVWFQDDGWLVFSDIPAGKLMSWTGYGGVEEWKPIEHSNGNALDPDGALVTCVHGLRAVVRHRDDGSLEPLATEWNGKRLNSPNDLAIQRDGTIWFTDPPWGLEDQRVGREQPGNFVYRIDGESGEVTRVLTDFTMPNGIALSPDEATLYVSDTGGHPSHPDPARHDAPATIRAFAIEGDGLASTEPLWTVEARSDGMCVDASGRLFATGRGAVTVWSPDGESLGELAVPEGPANVCFGGPEMRTLFITARTSLYASRVDG